MNLFRIFSEIEKIDGDAADRLSYTRRKLFAQLSSRLTAAAAPVAAGAVINKAYAQTGIRVADVLNYALTLEYLEDEFYRRGLQATGLIPQADRAIMTQIGKHEMQHVTFLRTALGANAVARPNFDFTARGQFPAFTNYQTFLVLAQAFEDLGVRAYKGQAGNLKSDGGVLTAALQIHSVEARHAAEVRRLRMQKGWITGNAGGGAPAAIYAGEENVMQGGVNVTSLVSAMGITNQGVSESFDEPLTMEQVLAIARPFLP